MAIDGDTVLPDSGEFNQIEGTVTTHEGKNSTASESEGEADDAQTGSYALRMTAVSEERETPDGWVSVKASQADFYNALVSGYATEIVERIEE